MITTADIVTHRLAHQQLTATTCQQPADVVAWLGAMQAQEYAMAKWAIGLRLPNSCEAAVEHAFATAAILRTHLLRPTWHFVTPADIRWLLALTAPRVHQANAFMYKKLELDIGLFHQSQQVLLGALQGGKQLTREALQATLQENGIVADSLRLGYIMMAAELDGLICSGARQGNQFTYALLNERVPPTTALTREEALAKLAQRYFASRGPATVQDFAWWSGLTLGEAKKGVALIRQYLAEEVLDGESYLLVPETVSARPSRPANFLLPDYDEYGISYKNRRALYGAHDTKAEKLAPLYNRMLVVDGLVVGSWKRTIQKDQVTIDLHPTTSPDAGMQQALLAAAVAYGNFLGKKARIVLHE